MPSIFAPFAKQPNPARRPTPSSSSVPKLKPPPGEARSLAPQPVVDGGSGHVPPAGHGAYPPINAHGLAMQAPGSPGSLAGRRSAGANVAQGPYGVPQQGPMTGSAGMAAPHFAAAPPAEMAPAEMAGFEAAAPAKPAPRRLLTRVLATLAVVSPFAVLAALGAWTIASPAGAAAAVAAVAGVATALGPVGWGLIGGGIVVLLAVTAISYGVYRSWKRGQEADRALNERVNAEVQQAHESGVAAGIQQAQQVQFGQQAPYGQPGEQPSAPQLHTLI